MPRIGAVGIGGLSGLVVSLRRGIPTKLIATTAGASIVGCVCFPKEAQEVANTLGHYRNITFNFIFGGMYVIYYYFIVVKMLLNLFI